MTAPARTADERAAALDRAQQVRRERAQLRLALHDRKVSAGDVVRDSSSNPAYGSLPVLWLLKAVPGFGDVRARRVMDRIGISVSRRLQGLGERQRTELILALEGR